MGKIAPNPFVEIPKIPVRFAPRPRCRICNNAALLPIVDTYLAKAHTAVFIRDKTSEMGFDISEDIIRKHKTHHVAEIDPVASKPEDLAILIRDRTIAAVKEGVLEPTIAHGLQAQALLDRRAEKTTDRQIALELARLLSGSSVTGLLEPPSDLVIIEGEAEEISE